MGVWEVGVWEVEGGRYCGLVESRPGPGACQSFGRRWRQLESY